MRSYFLRMPQVKESGLIARLGQLIELLPLEVNAASQTVVPGDVCFASGRGIATLSDEQQGQLASNILQQSAHLVITPPFPFNSCPWLLHSVPAPELYVTSFGPVMIVDEKLRQACGQNQLVILYNQAIRLSIGRPVAITSEENPVIVRYQHQSTWGQILYTTLLLGSTSSRSQRTHRIALAQGLVSWLTQVSRKAAPSTLTAPSQAPDLTYELPIILMAIHLTHQDKTLIEEQLKLAIDKIQTKLPRYHDDAAHASKFQFDEAVARLEAIEVLSPKSGGRWTVNRQQLAEEINQRHLASYLRRLR